MKKQIISSTSPPPRRIGVSNHVLAWFIGAVATCIIALAYGDRSVRSTGRRIDALFPSALPLDWGLEPQACFFSGLGSPAG